MVIYLFLLSWSSFISFYYYQHNNRHTKKTNPTISRPFSTSASKSSLSGGKHAKFLHFCGHATTPKVATNLQGYVPFTHRNINYESKIMID